MKRERLATFRNRFIARDDTFVWQWWSKEKQDGGYAVATLGKCTHDPPCKKLECPSITRRKLTDDILALHFSGKDTVGVYQLSLDNQVKWLCLDVDLAANYRGADGEGLRFARAHVKALAEVMQEHAIPFLVERSGAKGFHLWVFFSELVPAGQVQALGRFIDSMVGHSPAINVEVFPKQTTTGNRYGNLVRLPFGIHKKTGTRSVFVGKDFKPLAEQWAALDEVKAIPKDALEAFMTQHGLKEEAVIVEHRASGQESHGQHGLPCITKMLSDGLVEGTRDIGTYRIGCFLRGRGIPQESALDLLSAWNDKRNQPPMSEDVIAAKVESAYRNNYSGYPCQDVALDRYCSSECRFYESKMSTRNGNGRG